MNINMKHRFMIWAHWAVLLLMVLSFAACGSDGGGDNGEGSGSSVAKNENQNPASGYNTNKTSLKAAQRMEFPNIKKPAANYYVIVHTLSGTANQYLYAGKNYTFDADGINFCTIWDTNKKSQLCSCYRLHRGYGGSHNRVIGLTYPADEDLPSQYRIDDYMKGSGFQHGHILPQTERTFSYDANRQTNYLTNMQPQYPQFNGYDDKDNSHTGLWLLMEGKVQKLAKRLGANDTLFVCKGGTIQEGQVLKKLKNQMIVPKYFFMAVLRKTQSGYSAFGFWTEHLSSYVPSNYNLRQNAMSIAELEKLTGIDFFCNLPDDIEEKVEKSFSPILWDF